MRYRFLISLPLMLFIVIACGHKNLEKKDTPSKEITPIDWKIELENATTFTEETQILKTLIQQDTNNVHQQLIANRLQTFDLRHLSESEKLAVLNLYELSLQPAKKPSKTVLQIAYAKLSAIYPTNNELANLKIETLLASIKELSDEDLEF